MLYYLSNTTEDLNKGEVVQFFQNLPADPSKKEKIMTLAEQWISEGYEKGIEKGIGKGQVEIIVKQLRFKYGNSFHFNEKQLDQFTADQLETISQRILTCKTIEDVFNNIIP